MARLPQPGGDSGNWGTILNDYLAQAHDTDGLLKPASVTKSQLVSGVQTSLDKADAAATQVALDAIKPDGNVRAVGKGELTINMLDMVGGTNNGTTDHHTAFLAALDALPTKPNSSGAVGTIYFPAGVWNLSGNYANSTAKKWNIRGDGMGVTTIRRPAGSTNGDLFTFNATRTKISDVLIEGGRYQGVTGDSVVLNGSYTRCENVWFNKSGSNGLTIGKAGAAIAHVINGLTFRENAGRGIETIAGSGCTDGMWSDIDIGTTGGYGVYLGTGSQNIVNTHIWGSGLEHATENDGIMIASPGNDFVNLQSEKNLGRGIRVEGSYNTIKGKVWGNVFGGLYMLNAVRNDVDLLIYRNSVGNTGGAASDSYVQIFMSSSTYNRVRAKVWDDTVDMDPGSYVTAPTYPYPGRSGAIRTHTRILLESSTASDFNTYDLDAQRELTRLGSGVAPYTTAGTGCFFSPSCNWGTNVPLPTQSVVSGVVRIPAVSDTIIVSAAQEITSVVGQRQGRVARIIWTNASPLPIRDNGTTLNLNGDFSPTTGATLTLISDGTNWYETARSTN